MARDKDKQLAEEQIRAEDLRKKINGLQDQVPGSGVRCIQDQVPGSGARCIQDQVPAL